MGWVYKYIWVVIYFWVDPNKMGGGVVNLCVQMCVFGGGVKFGGCVFSGGGVFGGGVKIGGGGWIPR